ncbi:DNA mismatch repair protein MutT [Caulobacter sp. D4A]|uniref:NUDIX domain-containing protein n=1 Tax=unclassified Caulobacter TaxID=2648921 RepID=UPI000D730403|nr:MULTISPECIES: NUDIX hydrolase [unclassified Caulobacter]PXA83527.1 DNA mismatch repair protein MutT [Caulobacter sp. D4A]PXA89292.1 DNA mismatch repair protein MutT [Caulobacter sp. D5]
MSDDPIWLKPHGKPWGVTSAKVVYGNPWIEVTEYQTVAPTGRPALYGKVSFKNQAIGIVPLHADGTVTLVGQARFPRGNYSWEIPEGGAPMHENPLDGAKRELAEEVGLVAADWRLILELELSNSISDEFAHGFLAMDLSPTETAPDDTEDLAVARVPFQEALHAAVTGKMPDSLTVALLLRVHHMASVGELPAELAARVLQPLPKERAGNL